MQTETHQTVTATNLTNINYQAAQQHYQTEIWHLCTPTMHNATGNDLTNRKTNKKHVQQSTTPTARFTHPFTEHAAFLPFIFAC